MARRSALVTINDPKSRDAGKTFRITEMSAVDAERWAFRLLFALANGGAKLPDGMLESGLAGLEATIPGLLVQGLRSLAGLQYSDAAPLLEDMLCCAEFRAPGTDQFFSLSGTGLSQVEEVTTLLKLRYEVLQLHLNFSLADVLSTSKEPSPAAPSS